MKTYLMMSIKTKHANKIFNGSKTFEYRKKSIGENNLNKYCFIYSSEEEKAIIGYVIFDYIVSGNMDYVINNSKPENIDLLKKYFMNRDNCYGLHIKEYKLFDKYISLNEIKKIDKNFTVPQFYRYIKLEEKIFSLLQKNLSLHNMNLQPEFFNYIKNGTKKIEIRLNDEKRSNILIGDLIEFNNLDTNEKLKTIVINKYFFNTFDELVKNFNIELLADRNLNKEYIINSLNKFYSSEQQRRHGVVGLEIEIYENI